MVDIATLAIQVKTEGVQQANAQMSSLASNSEKAERATDKLGSSFAGATRYMVAAAAALAAMGLGLFIKQCIDAQLQVERLGRLMNAAAGSANLGAREMEYARAVTKKYGLDLVTTTESYGRFMAAVRGTTMEGEKGRAVFEAVSKASTALGMRADETAGVFKALEQMMSKGKVQAEELRGQLGERLPGAFLMAAKAMGMSTAELDKNLVAGKVMADDLLPKLAAELEKTYGAAAVEAAKSAQAEINRFNNALFESKAAVGAALMPAMGDILSSLRPVIEMVGTAIKAFQQLAVSYAVTMGKISAAQEVGWFGLMTKSGRAQYKQGAANAEEAGWQQYQEIENRYKRPTSTGYTAAELLRQSQNKPVTPAGKDGKGAADKAAREAEQWRKTYADLRKEVDALTPGLDEYAKKISDIDNKYTDLMHKKGADIVLLQQLRAEHLKAIEVQKQVDATSKEFKALATAEEEAANLAQAQQEVEDWNRSVRDMVAALDPAIVKEKQFSDGIYDINRAFGEDEAGGAIDAYINDFFKLKDVLSSTADMKINMIEDPYERQRAAMVKYYDTERAKINESLKIHKASGKEQSDAYKALMSQRATLDAEQAQKAKQIAAEENSAKLSMVSNYASTAAGLFTALADTQDQTSRKGFETAKAFNIAAAVMSTAAAVMNALATVQPYPLAIVAAAGAAAAGVIQIAKIASTTFGGGAGSVGSVSVGFSGGGGNTAGGGSVGGSISAPYTSVGDNQTEASLQALAASADNASLALNKVSDGLTNIADLFSSDRAKLLSGSITQGEYINPAGSNFSQSWNSLKDSAKKLVEPISGLINGFGSLVTTTLKMFFGFGNEWYTKAQGLKLGGTGTAMTSMGYLEKQKDGGWFTSDKHSTEKFALDPGLTGALDSYMQQIRATIVRAATVMGTDANLESAILPAGKIKTSGRSAEDIQKDLEKWFGKAADAMGQTVTGLKDFTYYGESAFDALVRLASALQNVNEKLSLIGAGLINSTLAGADAADNLQNLMGGADKFNEAIDTYFTSMFTESEQKAMKAAQATRQVSVAFAEMDRAVPKTRTDFIGLVNSLDVTTEAGASTFAALMSVSEAFALMTESAATASEEMRTAFLDTAMSAAEALKNILGGSFSTLTPSQMLFQQQGAWNGAVSTGNTTALPGLAESYLTSAREMFGSGTGYTKIYETVTRTLADVAGISGDITLDNVQRQIDAITRVQDAIAAGTMAMVNSIAELRAEIAAMRKDADANAQKIVNATDNSADTLAGTFAAVARA
jgi:tape measure domain-containing protein